jgi:purine-nucleoside phosphorylase
LAQSLAQAVAIPYEQIPFFAPSTVEGHKGQLVMGRMGSRDIAVMNGRLHYYEGYSLQQTTFPIRVLKQLGCETLIITNAAGGLNPAFAVGDLMLITDHINLPGFAGNSPLYGPNDAALGVRFPDMHNAYDRDLRALATDAAKRMGLTLRSGVYAMLGGPAFETPAEVRFLRAIGADAVGMSTAAEVIIARHGGQRVLGISMISNMLSPDPDAPLVNHEEVLAAGHNAVKQLVPLLTNVISHI